MKVVKAEDKSVATEEAPETAQESAIDTKSQETASIETKTEPESQADATVPTAPKATADPVREAFNKALALPKNSKERLAALKDVAGKDPQVLMYQRMLIDEYFRQGLYPECITACDQALLIKPDDSLLLTVQGAAHFELNQLVEARVAYEKAVNSDPKNWYARYNLAQTLTVLKLPEAAIAWRNYLEVAGDDPAQATYVEEARRNLAQLAENSLK
jgi:Flp pilus assembly protein TadD